MEKIYLRKKTAYTFGGTALFFALLFVIFLIVMLVEREYNMLYILIVMFFFFAIFLLIAYTEYKGSLVLDETGVTFHYRNISKSKELSKAGLRLNFDDIDHIDRVEIGEAGLFTKSSFMYRFHLSDGQQVDAFLHYFGEKMESEIVAELEKKVSVSDKELKF